MPSGAYDPSIQSLLKPGDADLPFDEFDWSQPQAMDIEFSRLAYIHAQQPGTQRQRLEASLQKFGFKLAGVAHDAATGAYAFCAVSDSLNRAIIAFRGTEPADLRDIGADLLVLPTSWGDGDAQVHAGFALAYNSVREDVTKWMQSLGAGVQATFVGHSLGGALAMLAGAQFQQARVTTVGAPRTGNQAFVSLIPNGQLTRVVCCADIVATLPPDGLFGYRHPTAFTYLDSQGQLHTGPDAEFVAQDQQAGRAWYLSRYTLVPGALPFRDLADHAPINYLNCFRRLP